MLILYVRIRSSNPGTITPKSSSLARIELRPCAAYLQLGGDGFKTTVDENAEDVIVWQALDEARREVIKRARLPGVIFVG